MVWTQFIKLENMDEGLEIVIHDGLLNQIWDENIFEMRACKRCPRLIRNIGEDVGPVGVIQGRARVVAI